VTSSALRRGLALEYVTLGWNVVGVAVLAAAAVMASSVALAGFGLDSGIEIFASLVVVWQLRSSADVAREQRALRLIGAAFLVLVAYIGVQAVWVLVTAAHPDASGLGIVWTALTCVVMLLLAAGKARTGRTLGNEVLMAEGRVTLVDAYLAGSVLVGLVLNAALGWWWADPAAALVIVGYGWREARAAFCERSGPSEGRSRS
jgi:divalent metal cation (Fe/Co/Zn/Cd) transporter